jgi:hypothetical protein
MVVFMQPRMRPVRVPTEMAVTVLTCGEGWLGEGEPHQHGDQAQVGAPLLRQVLPVKLNLWSHGEHGMNNILAPWSATPP